MTYIYLFIACLSPLEYTLYETSDIIYLWHIYIAACIGFLVKFVLFVTICTLASSVIGEKMALGVRTLFSNRGT